MLFRFLTGASLLAAGAIFGFFYAWVCSTMWGLDAGRPQMAIEAMQAMNASVRNLVFAPAFFGTPLILLATAAVARMAGAQRAAVLFLLASLVYLGGAFAPTFLVNVPMNEALAVVQIPDDTEQARMIWRDYSSRWQLWNQFRTLASAASLLLVGLAIAAAGRQGMPRSASSPAAR
ncbi:DUF1772 domain-containing protein [Paracoccus sp. M683]|uniref:anthrone oxygenase family protein n=1 Tax=Paracoccus sp. M683 TaxID=2594268 RepID=UPI00117D88F0|nr:anthrone oxygenase family protein [Paracoccus sp. M683]TRW97326.1 DUF1772 domain-containing protein [Paracoccus sp. M683]